MDNNISRRKFISICTSAGLCGLSISYLSSDILAESVERGKVPYVEKVKFTDSGRRPIKREADLDKWIRVKTVENKIGGNYM